MCIAYVFISYLVSIHKLSLTLGLGCDVCNVLTCLFILIYLLSRIKSSLYNPEKVKRPNFSQIGSVVAA